MLRGSLYEKLVVDRAAHGSVSQQHYNEQVKVYCTSDAVLYIHELYSAVQRALPAASVARAPHTIVSVTPRRPPCPRQSPQPTHPQSAGRQAPPPRPHAPPYCETG